MTQHMCCKRRLVRTEVQCVSSLSLVRGKPLLHEGKSLSLAREQNPLARTNLSLLPEDKPLSCPRKTPLARTTASCLPEGKPLLLPEDNALLPGQFSLACSKPNLSSLAWGQISICFLPRGRSCLWRCKARTFLVSFPKPNLSSVILGSNYFWTD